MQANRNILLSTDSYKLSHFLQYPPSVIGMSSYIEARRNNSDIPNIPGTIFFGLQAYLKDYLCRPVTKEDIEELEEVAALHGEPCPTQQLKKIISQYKGFLPLTIRAVKEGTFVPFGNGLVTVDCIDPDLKWLASYIETQILRGVWYPTTVASISKWDRQVIWDYLQKTSDDPAGQIAFKLHDFGARGVSSAESAALGGLGHLVNFMGTDTMEALLAARKFYGAKMAGFSIPAAEHSTITSWGRDCEEEAYRNMVKQFSKPGAIYAVVSDSYNIDRAVETLWGENLKAEVIAGGGLLVVRPDSGDPVDTPLRVARTLANKFGAQRNGKGYDVINGVRVIQGDGINSDSLSSICRSFDLCGLSIDNIAFGKGGAGLQKLDRDTFSFAMKCSAVQHEDGSWTDVYKDPIGGGKTSKKGRLGLYATTEEKLEAGEYIRRETLETCRIEDAAGRENKLEVVWDKGFLMREQSLDEIRQLSVETYDAYHRIVTPELTKSQDVTA
jgi:nicotinamide phosphoribosyltransferase